MKTIGLIGGMSWESTAEYYRIINETVRQKLGGLHSAKILMANVDYVEIAEHQLAGDWENCARLVGDEAVRLQEAGADFIVLATNTMHKVATDIEARLSIPLWHVADATAAVLKAAGVQRVGFLGTKTTMTEPFYKERLTAQGVELVLPGVADMDDLDKIIFNELCCGTFYSSSRMRYRNVMKALAAQGAEAIVLGCTEIGLLVETADSPVPLFDTTVIHAETAALNALVD